LRNTSSQSNQHSQLTNSPRAGIIGLSTAHHIQQHLAPTQSLLVVARDFPSSTSIDYTSPWAGAHYRPIPGTSAQARKEANQARRTYEHFKSLSASEPDAGIRFIEGIEHLEAPPAEYVDGIGVDVAYGHLDDFRHLGGDDDDDGSELPEGVRWGVRYKTYVVNSPVYCAFLLRRILSNGGRTRACTLSNAEEAFRLDRNVRAVINCSGLGFGDAKSFIIRGIRHCIPLSLSWDRQK
jgi:D-amino-acid oxidase